MLKNILPFFLFVLFLNAFTSQAQSITVSEDLTLRDDASYELLGTMHGHTLIFRDKTSEFEVQAFDERLRKSWSKEIILDKRRPEVIGVMPRKNEFSIFYRHKIKSEVRLKMHTYDAAANLIDSMTVKNYGALFNSPRLEALRSEDRSKIVVYEIENQQKIKALSFDLNTKSILWEMEMTKEGLGWIRDFREMIVSNTGDLYIVFEENNRKSQLKEHFLAIYHLNKNIQRYQIDIPKYLTYDITFSFDNKNEQLLAGGLYAEENFAHANGYFYLRIPPNNPSNHLIEYTPFEDEFVFNFLEKNDERKPKNKGITDTDIQEIVLRSDGGILMIGERNRTNDRSAGQYASNYTRGPLVDYYFDDLFIISIHPDGTTHWKNVLHKKQYSQDDDAVYSSYFLATTPRALRLLFNDDIKYENTVSEYVINATGDFDRNAVMSTESQRLRLRFQDAMQVSASELIVPSESRNRLKLVRVKYE